MRLVIPGGSGQVGTLLARAFTRDGHDVVVLSRAPRNTAPANAACTVLSWDGRSSGPWCQALEGADAVINLAGHSVDCRYNAANRKRILVSRVDSTRAVGRAIAACARPPRVWLQASTATLYAHRYDTANGEAHGVIGGSDGAPDAWRFSIEVARAWERALDEVPTPATRKVALRSAMTMSPERGGIFDVLLGLVRRGLGGTSGNGRQYVSWIHHEDFVRALYWILDREHLAGPINLAAPHPLPNREFMAALRRAHGIRFGLPASRLMLEVGAVFLRTETELILKSRRVVPERLLADGFVFQHPHWSAAAEALCKEWRANASPAVGAAATGSA